MNHIDKEQTFELFGDVTELRTKLISLNIYSFIRDGIVYYFKYHGNMYSENAPYRLYFVDMINYTDRFIVFPDRLHNIDLCTNFIYTLEKPITIYQVDDTHKVWFDKCISSKEVFDLEQIIEQNPDEN